jgi:hypothetical protein
MIEYYLRFFNIRSFTPGTQTCQVHIVDDATKEIVHMSSISIETKVPVANRKFEYELPINQGSVLSMNYENKTQDN